MTAAAVARPQLPQDLLAAVPNKTAPPSKIDLSSLGAAGPQSPPPNVNAPASAPIPKPAPPPSVGQLTPTKPVVGNGGAPMGPAGNIAGMPQDKDDDGDSITDIY